MQKKFPVVYSYKPENEYEEVPTSNFRFPNSSGNPIRREKNFRVIGEDIPRKDRNDIIEEKEEESDAEPELDVKDLEKAAIKK